MDTINTNTKREYHLRVQPFLTTIKDLNKLNADINKSITEAKLAENYFLYTELTLKLLDNNLYEITTYIAIVRLAQTLLKIQSEQYTTLARKKCHTYLQLWETLVGRMLDTPLTEKTPKHQYVMTALDNIALFNIFKKLGFCIDRLELLQGDSSRWKWTFIDIKSRMLTVLKNALNFKILVQDVDPANKDYKKSVKILEFFKKFMSYIAEEYRRKYEIQNQNIEDMKKALSYLSIFKRFILLTGGDPEELTMLKKKYDIWKKKLEIDMSKSSKG